MYFGGAACYGCQCCVSRSGTMVSPPLDESINYSIFFKISITIKPGEPTLLLRWFLITVESIDIIEYYFMHEQIVLENNRINRLYH